MLEKGFYKGCFKGVAGVLKFGVWGGVSVFRPFRAARLSLGILGAGALGL